MMCKFLFFLVLFHQGFMFLVMHCNNAFDPTSVIKLRVPPFNVLVNDSSVLLQCKFCIIIDFMRDKFSTNFFLLVDVLLIKL